MGVIGYQLTLTNYALRVHNTSQYNTGTNLSNVQLGSILGQRNGKDLIVNRINLFLI